MIRKNDKIILGLSKHIDTLDLGGNLYVEWRNRRFLYVLDKPCIYGPWKYRSKKKLQAGIFDFIDRRLEGANG